MEPAKKGFPEETTSKPTADDGRDPEFQDRLDAMLETVWQAKGSELLPLVDEYRLADSPQTRHPEDLVREGIRRTLHFVAQTDRSLRSWNRRENLTRLREEVKALVKHTPHYNAVFTRIWQEHADRLEELLGATLRGSALQSKADPHEEVRRGISHFLSKQIKSRGAIDSWTEHTGLLFAIVIAQQKNRWDFWSAQLRDFRREQSLDGVLQGPGHGEGRGLQTGSPDFGLAIIRDEVNQHMDSLVSLCSQHVSQERKQAICARLTGCSFEDVARKTAMSVEEVEDAFDEFVNELWRQVTPELEQRLDDVL